MQLALHSLKAASCPVQEGYSTLCSESGLNRWESRAPSHPWTDLGWPFLTYESWQDRSLRWYDQWHFFCLPVLFLPSASHLCECVSESSLNIVTQADKIQELANRVSWFVLSSPCYAEALGWYLWYCLRWGSGRWIKHNFLLLPPFSLLPLPPLYLLVVKWG